MVVSSQHIGHCMLTLINQVPLCGHLENVSYKLKRLQFNQLDGVLLYPLDKFISSYKV